LQMTPEQLADYYKEVRVVKVKLAFYKEKSTLFDRLVMWWTKGPYSHVELVFESSTPLWGDQCYTCFSASPNDGGTRWDLITDLYTSDKWDVVNVAYVSESVFRDIVWYINTTVNGKKYDWAGIFGFVWKTGQDQSRWFCSEVCLHVLQQMLNVMRGYEPSQVSPNRLFEIVQREVGGSVERKKAA
jgi:hypothetical protein